MKRTSTAAVVIGAVGALVLSGCAANGAPGDGPVEVTVWHYWDGTNADAFDAL